MDHFTIAYFLIAVGLSILFGLCVAVCARDGVLDTFLGTIVLSLTLLTILYGVGLTFVEAWGHLKLWWAEP